jgi:hypothetical protein
VLNEELDNLYFLRNIRVIRVIKAKETGGACNRYRRNQELIQNYL